LSQIKKTDLSELIAEEFGANAAYVQGLLDRFQSNPALVDDSWRSYFSELLDGGGNGAAAVAAPARAPEPKPAPAVTAPAPEPRIDSQEEVVPIRGPAAKIVENMETSLSVPTATSERRIPVKLLDENRRLINKHLSENDRGKASYTHLIAWAVLRALESYPQLNDGFAEVEFRERVWFERHQDDRGASAQAFHGDKVNRASSICPVKWIRLSQCAP